MFYTYLWLREDGTPYYVGKGKGDRAFKKNKHIQYPPVKERIVIHPASSEQDAFDTEISLIWYYGRKDLGTGCLRNLTDGGEGSSGWVASESVRRHMSISQVGRKHSADTRRKISEANLGKPKSEAHKAKMSIAAKNNPNFNSKGRKPSPETLEKLRKAVLGKPARNPAVDITGEVFGKLSALGRAPRRNTTEGARWLCRCTCGREISVLYKSLHRGTKSCLWCRR